MLRKIRGFLRRPAIEPLTAADLDQHVRVNLPEIAAPTAEPAKQPGVKKTPPLPSRKAPRAKPKPKPKPLAKPRPKPKPRRKP